jgi:hypothetical protein
VSEMGPELTAEVVHTIGIETTASLVAEFGGRCVRVCAWLAARALGSCVARAPSASAAVL